jgi:hypothetical protein
MVREPLELGTQRAARLRAVGRRRQAPPRPPARRRARTQPYCRRTRARRAGSRVDGRPAISDSMPL